MSEIWRELWLDFPRLFQAHLHLSLLAVWLGVSISVPLALMLSRFSRCSGPVLSFVAVIQTIPSLALLALMVPVLVFLGEQFPGWDLPALGFWPTLTALTLYSILPILRNTLTGLLQVDPASIEAARGMGMTDFQTLLQVQLPLAMPVMIAGLRTAAVWTVGTATLATPVGQECLGNYIFTGLHTRQWESVIFGCLAAALMAVSLDLTIGLIERFLHARRPRAAWGCLLVLLSITVATAWPTSSLRQPAMGMNLTGAGSDEFETDQAETELVRSVVLGGKTFTEQYILIDLLADRLQQAGLEVQTTESLGSTVVFDGLVAGEIDCYVDYSGTIWANHMHREDTLPAWQVRAEMSAWLSREHGIRCLGSLGFENAYALAIRRETADRLRIRSIADLAEHASQLAIGGDYEFFGRPEWTSIRSTYELAFREERSFDSTFMYSAVANGEVDVISAYSSDGRIAAFDLVVLEDPRQAIPPYEAVVLLSARVAGDRRVVRTLQPLIDSIRLKQMQQANLLVDRDEDSQTVNQASAWLARQIDR